MRFVLGSMSVTAEANQQIGHIKISKYIRRELRTGGEICCLGMERVVGVDVGRGEGCSRRRGRVSAHHVDHTASQSATTTTSRTCWSSTAISPGDDDDDDDAHLPSTTSFTVASSAAHQHHAVTGTLQLTG